MNRRRWGAAAGVLAVVLVMAGVYLFSAQSGSSSSGLSQGALELIRQQLPPLYRLLARGGRPEYALRKLAHLSEYAVLGLAVYVLLRRRLAPGEAAVTPLVLCAGFALTDEWHQLYVPGRDGNIRDVFIDTVGSGGGIGIGLLGTRARWLVRRYFPGKKAEKKDGSM